jgi:hypothetical protein
MHSEFQGVNKKSPKLQAKASKDQKRLFLLVKMTKGEGKGKFFGVLKFGPGHEGVWLTETLDICIFLNRCSLEENC